MKTKRLVRIALMAAVLCVLAPWKIPVGPIPITLASFGVYLAAGLLGPVEGTAAVTVYVLLGAVGVPVFSGFTGGAGCLLGLTGGYILGYIPCAAISGWLMGRQAPAWRRVLALLAGTAVLYALGTAMFCIQSGKTLVAALSACVVPFLPLDAVKIVVCTAALPLLWRLRQQIESAATAGEGVRR